MNLRVHLRLSRCQTAYLEPVTLALAMPTLALCINDKMLNVTVIAQKSAGLFTGELSTD